MVTINGKTYKGNNLQISGNQVFIDGKQVGPQEGETTINITVDSNVQTLDVDYCDKLEITGDCGNVTSKNGDIQVKGNVGGDVINKNGNIVCRDVGGDAETKNGNVIHS